MKARVWVALFLLSLTVAATEPNAATRRWWQYVTALSGDDLEGRDTGSPAYQRAARYVATELEHVGIQPAGEQGYFQPVPMQRIPLNTASSTVALERKAGTRKLVWLHEITMNAASGLPAQ